MSYIYTFLMLIIVGAIIGGVTNYLAIKMLFRPYHAIYIGKFKVPFTPGVIPKRQEEIAKQLGKLVMTHLITADSIERKLQSAPFVEKITLKMQDELTRFLKEEKTLNEVLSSFMDVNQLQRTLEEKGAVFTKEKLHEGLSTLKNHSMQTMLPAEVLESVETRLPHLSRVIQEHTIEFLASEEGKMKIKGQIDRFFEGRGMMAQMLNMFLGNQSLIDRVHPEFLKFLSQPSFREMLDTMIVKEWIKVREQPIGELLEQWEIDERPLLNYLNAFIDEEITLDTLFQTSLLELVKDHQGTIVEIWIPRLIIEGLKLISKKVNEWLSALDIEEIVADQVRDFSFQELEQVILLISKREFSMITYLGAVLGGVIGLLQGIIMTVIK